MDDVYQRDILSRYPVPRHRLTVRDYYRLAEVGILRRNDRVELLEGQLVDMSPIGPRHALVSGALTRLLVLAAADRAHVRVQLPIKVDDYSEPEPDFALVRQPWEGHPNAHPKPRDVLLLVEVSDSSLDYDRGAKRELYARAAVREFWIVDLTTNSVLVHRDPKDGVYGSVASVDMSGTLHVEALPGVAIAVASLFG
jgi:Uma2 family endonuclease